MAQKSKSPGTVESPAAVEASEPNGSEPEKEKTIVTDFTLKLQHHKDVPKVPVILENIEAWAKDKGYVVVKKETSTPGYYSWTVHTTESAADAERKANNVMREVRSLRDDEAVKAEAAKLGITVDELLKRALLSVRRSVAAKA